MAVSQASSQLHIKAVALQRKSDRQPIRSETTGLCQSVTASFVFVKSWDALVLETHSRLSGLSGSRVRANKTTCCVVLILTANIYKNAQGVSEAKHVFIAAKHNNFQFCHWLARLAFAPAVALALALPLKAHLSF